MKIYYFLIYFVIQNECLYYLLNTPLNKLNYNILFRNFNFQNIQNDLIKNTSFILQILIESKILHKNFL
jgi:hypothetical protein